MSSTDDRTFEALLKPLLDITSKVWDYALTKALENYLVLINNGANTGVNFAEAALLVQNSTHFYCKRVDLVHLGCLQFVEKLMDTYCKVFGRNKVMNNILHENLNKDTDGKEGSGPVNRKKRTPKTYVGETFEPIDIFSIDSNINVTLESIDKSADKKDVILNKYPKVNRKPNSACPVYQTGGTEMGFKDEFRLNWSSSETGVLHEDSNFISHRKNVHLGWLMLPNEVLEVARNSLIQLEHSFHMDVDHTNQEVNHNSSLRPATPLREPSPFSDSPPRQPMPPPTTDVAVAEKPPARDPYKELLFNFVTPPVEFFKKKQFSLPKDFIDDIKDWKARKVEAKENAKKKEYTFSSYFDFLKHQILLQCPSAKKVKLMKSAKLRKREILMRSKYFEKACADAAQDCDADFAGFDDNVHNDEDIENIQDCRLDENVDMNPVEVGGFEQERDAILLKHNRRRDPAIQTEVARRVQAWHESLVDVLSNAESRAIFDIHEYGSKILDRFTDNVQVIKFADIVQGLPHYEISRFLLSTLMLANTYNVELRLDQLKEVVASDCLSLKFLSRVRHHEEMDENLRSNTHC